MANIINYLGYQKATGRNSFLRIFQVVFSGSYVQNYGEVLNFATAQNPYGIEDFQVPNTAAPSIPPMILDTITGGYRAELEYGGTGTIDQYGVNFYTSGGTQLAAEAYSTPFPATATINSVQQYGQLIIGILDSLG
jgi:hypothetical protein